MISNGDKQHISLTVMILTYNEEKNIEKLLESIHGWVEQICLIDSGSNDATLAIAEKYGASVLYNPFENQAQQFNWGLQHFPITTDWIMRLDADEEVTPELASELTQRLPTFPNDISGLYVKRRVYFMGRWIRHGAMYPTWLLRIFRAGYASYEVRSMDEHLVLREGLTSHLQNDIIDENLNDLRYFTLKHEAYAQRELNEVLSGQVSSEQLIKKTLQGSQPEKKRWLQGNFYMRAPLFWRATAYFLYRYIIRLGFLDGSEGLIFHTLQGFWYRFYVDAKIFESQRELFKRRNATR